MKYLLVENREIVHLGPIEWRPRFIQSELDDLEVGITISPTEVGYIKINDKFEIFPVVEDITPQYHSVYNVLAGPFYTYGDTSASMTHTVLDNDIFVIQSKLKEQVAAERWNKQNKGTTVDIDGQTISVGTDNDSLSKFVTLLNSVGTEPINYKSNIGFISLDKTDLQNIVDTINTHIQTQFNWELSTAQTIDSLNSIDELKAVVIVEPVTPGV